MSNIVYLEGYRISRDAKNGETRIRDIEVAEKLGLRVGWLRDIIRCHQDELRDFGELVRLPENSNDYGFFRDSRHNSKRGRGRPRKDSYWLNRDQVLLVCMWSETTNARLVRKELVRVFNAYLTGQQKPIRSYIAEVLRLDALSDWRQMWPLDFVEAICKLKRLPYSGKQPGGWMSQVYADLYRALLGDEIYETMREANPRPSHGKNHHQLLREQARKRVESEIHVVTAFAKTSGTYGEFISKVRHHYQGVPLQLTFAG